MDKGSVRTNRRHQWAREDPLKINTLLSSVLVALFVQDNSKIAVSIIFPTSYAKQDMIQMLQNNSLPCSIKQKNNLVSKELIVGSFPVALIFLFSTADSISPPTHSHIRCTRAVIGVYYSLLAYMFKLAPSIKEQLDMSWLMLCDNMNSAPAGDTGVASVFICMFGF